MQEASHDTYLVLDDFGGRQGRAWRETDEQATSRETLIRDLMDGQYGNSARIVAFNTAEGWTRDVTKDIADELRRRFVELRKRCKCGYADKWPSCQKLHLRACCPVEHPCWNLQPTICLRSIQRAAEGDIASLVDGPMNANSATKPRMISIKNLAKNGPVGVLKPCCTTTGVRTRRWAISPRRLMPPISPQRAIGCATPTSSADRTLLHPRQTA